MPARGMAASSSQAASAGGLALGGSRGAHPTVRLDKFLRTTDAGYQHAEGHTQGDRFIRKMATYGQVRPSVSFTNESRVVRPMKEHAAMDMSNLPHQRQDPRGDPREGTFEIEAPPKEIDQSYVKMFANQSLMLPSERYVEHLAMKAGHAKWKEDRDAVFFYRKRMNVLERKHPEGILGVDGPTHPDTVLYQQRHEQLRTQAERAGRHAENRFQHLHQQNYADDAVAQRYFGADPGMERSKDICIQRKCVDPELHPFRYLDTHDRLFPKFNPVWDPERAAALRSHDIREKSHDIISGAHNAVPYKVALPWEEAQKQQMAKRAADAMATQPRRHTEFEL